MRSFRQSMIAVVGLVVLGIVISLLVSPSARAQMKNVVSVLVVNDATQPVPVTGTVNVGNLGDTPLPVGDSDNPARQPFQIRLNDSVNGPSEFTVPAGKRLVIEVVAIDSRVDGTGCVVRPVLTTTVNGVRVGHLVTVDYLATQGSTNAVSFYGTHQQTRLYADPGTKVETFNSPLVCPVRATDWTISGYFVDIQ